MWWNETKRDGPASGAGRAEGKQNKMENNGGEAR